MIKHWFLGYVYSLPMICLLFFYVFLLPFGDVFCGFMSGYIVITMTLL